MSIDVLWLAQPQSWPESRRVEFDEDAPRHPVFLGWREQCDLSKD